MLIFLTHFVSILGPLMTVGGRPLVGIVDVVAALLPHPPRTTIAEDRGRDHALTHRHRSDAAPSPDYLPLCLKLLTRSTFPPQGKGAETTMKKVRKMNRFD